MLFWYPNPPYFEKAFYSYLVHDQRNIDLFSIYCNFKYFYVLIPKMPQLYCLKGQSHEKVGEMSVWGISLGPN
jgi:hypothetical protein